MARLTDQERLEKMNEKIEQMKARKQQLKSRVDQRERKARTRRLIQVGAIFEGYFMEKDNPLSKEQAEKIAYRLAESVKEKLDDYLKTDVEKSKEKNKIVYEVKEEKLIIPDTKVNYSTTEREKTNEED